MESMATAALPGTGTAGRRSALGRLAQILDADAFVVLALGGCAALQAALMRTAIVPDTWLSLLAGGTIAKNGLPHHETLTAIAAGRTWVDQQWLAHLGLYGLWAAGGWPAALIAGIVVYAGSFAVLAGSARGRGASGRSVAVLLVCCYLTGLRGGGLRAQTPAYLTCALVLALLLADERRPSRRVYLALPLLVLWANLHGSVLLGAALVTAYGALSAVRGARRGSVRVGRAAVLIVVPWLCILASPYALDLPGYYRSVLANRTLAHAASEWARSTLQGQPFFYALLALAVALVAFGRRRLSPLGLVALGGSAVLGVLAVRNIVWFALVAAAVLPAALDAVWPERPSVRRPRLNAALAIGGAALAVAVTSAVASRGAAWFERPYPRAAATAVASAARADPGARIFSDEIYSDWLLFEHPALAGRVAYDIRYELLRQPELRRILSFRKERGPNWQQAANGYRLLVLDPGGDIGAVRLFERRPGTKVLYQNGDVIVLRVGAAG
jgi:hypothetical protein